LNSLDLSVFILKMGLPRRTSQSHQEKATVFTNNMSPLQLYPEVDAAPIAPDSAVSFGNCRNTQLPPPDSGGSGEVGRACVRVHVLVHVRKPRSGERSVKGRCCKPHFMTPLQG
jgi:hypothetical protein